MKNRKKLRAKQLAVLDDIFEGSLTEAEVLAKHEVSVHIFRRWLADELFQYEYECRVAAAVRQGRVLIAKYASLAAAKLVALADSQSAETARRACMDIISLPQGGGGDEKSRKEGKRAARPMTSARANKLLAALAKID